MMTAIGTACGGIPDAVDHGNAGYDERRKRSDTAQAGAMSEESPAPSFCHQVTHHAAPLGFRNVCATEIEYGAHDEDRYGIIGKQDG